MAIPDFLRKSVLVFDTETAQLGDHVVEIGFSLFKNTELINETNSFVRSLIPIDPAASNVHKIYDKDIEDSPTFQQLSMWIYNILNSVDYHCAYNYEYDRKVLENEFNRIGMKFPFKPMIDPFIFFKKWHKMNKGKKLTDAATRYGISLVGAHRAVNDATATGQILFKMAATRTDFPKTMDKLIDVQRKLVEKQFDDFYNYCKRVGRDLPIPPNYVYYEVPA